MTRSIFKVLQRCFAVADAGKDALVNRGFAHGLGGDAASAIADFTRCIDLPGAPAERVAQAHLGMAMFKGPGGDPAGLRGHLAPAADLARRVGDAALCSLVITVIEGLGMDPKDFGF
ncbi:MAG: hypothetical protein KF787_10965 [Phycisphaeraceae bacterium]|nr:hypothetical protein [Phycisphaerae bacterium]MBX3393156.1 hypothetical protein [Phycisphaeraceae bacterium]